MLFRNILLFLFYFSFEDFRNPIQTYLSIIEGSLYRQLFRAYFFNNSHFFRAFIRPSISPLIPIFLLHPEILKRYSWNRCIHILRNATNGEGVISFLKSMNFHIKFLKFRATKGKEGRRAGRILKNVT